VRTAGGVVHARRAVLAACDAEILYGSLVAESDLPPAFVARMAQFHRADGTVKVNHALSAPVPWVDEQARSAGTIHVADSLDELTVWSAQLATGQLPDRPFLLVGQMTTADPTRSPPGTESMWTYTHVPQEIRHDAVGEIKTGGRLEGEALAAFVDRIEDRIEARAPGFRELVVARHVQGPVDLERDDPSLIGGDISGGTSQLHQQLVFRPVPGLARPSTPIDALYLASASAHPGGSVHGACGANAARAALLHDRAASARRMLTYVTARAASLSSWRRRGHRPAG
jgi:phytoene dehydrogenase-like protein